MSRAAPLWASSCGPIGWLCRSANACVSLWIVCACCSKASCSAALRRTSASFASSSACLTRSVWCSVSSFPARPGSICADPSAFSFPTPCRRASRALFTRFAIVLGSAVWARSTTPARRRVAFFVVAASFSNLVRRVSSSFGTLGRAWSVSLATFAASLLRSACAFLAACSALARSRRNVSTARVFSASVARSCNSIMRSIHGKFCCVTVDASIAWSMLAWLVSASSLRMASTPRCLARPKSFSACHCSAQARPSSAMKSLSDAKSRPVSMLSWSTATPSSMTVRELTKSLYAFLASFGSPIAW